MGRPDRRRGDRGGWRLFLFTALFVVVADQLTKQWILALLFPHKVVPLFGPVRLALVYNRGVAFGLFANQPYLSVAVLLAVVLIFFFYRTQLFHGLVGHLCFGLIVGGAVGNLIDRFRLGHVIDFVDLGFWPVFNLADASVSVGVALLAYSLLSVARKGRMASE